MSPIAVSPCVWSNQSTKLEAFPFSTDNPPVEISSTRILEVPSVSTLTQAVFFSSSAMRLCSVDIVKKAASSIAYMHDRWLSSTPSASLVESRELNTRLGGLLLSEVSSIELTDEMLYASINVAGTAVN